MSVSKALDEHFVATQSPSVDKPFDLFDLVSKEYCCRVDELLAENWFNLKEIPYSIMVAIDKSRNDLMKQLEWLNLARTTRLKNVTSIASNDDNYALVA